MRKELDLGISRKVCLAADVVYRLNGVDMKDYDLINILVTTLCFEAGTVDKHKNLIKP
jgi:hypothetical protein